MSENEEAHDSDDEFVVVVNHEEQYSIWLAHRPLPAGWREVGQRGTKSECLSYIEKVWVDMRPLSLRQRMAEWASDPPPEVPQFVDEAPPLADRLSGNNHRVEFRTRVKDRVKYLKERIDLGYVHLVFPETRGGTELGFRLNAEACRLDKADFERGTGQVELVGSLTLDDVAVECRAQVQLADLTGVGGLRRVATGENA